MLIRLAFQVYETIVYVGIIWFACSIFALVVFVGMNMIHDSIGNGELLPAMFADGVECVASAFDDREFCDLDFTSAAWNDEPDPVK